MLRILATTMTAFALVAGCTGKEEASEPVAADNSPPVIPDVPGESGEGAEKPAGAGAAGEVAEKSQPNLEAAAKAKPDTTEPGIVLTNGLNVRSGAGMSFPVVRVLKQGEKVTLSDCGTVWCKIGDGEFVAKRFVSN